MFWIGTLYRIREYGFTEPRVYLVVVGLILTGAAVLFSVKRWASYLYVACWAILLLASVTYIPGMTAKNIEHISQMSRKDDPMKKSWEVEYIHISSDKPVDIRGYNTMASLRSYKMSDAARLVAEMIRSRFTMKRMSWSIKNPMMVFGRAIAESRAFAAGSYPRVRLSRSSPDRYGFIRHYFGGDRLAERFRQSY